MNQKIAYRDLERTNAADTRAGRRYEPEEFPLPASARGVSASEFSGVAGPTWTLDTDDTIHVRSTKQTRDVHTFQRRYAVLRLGHGATRAPRVTALL